MPEGPLAADPTRERVDRFAVLVLLTWSAAVVPMLLSSILSKKYRTGVGAQLVGNPLARLAERSLTLALIAWCLVVVAMRARQLPTDRRLSLVVLLAPWVYLVSRDLYNDRPPRMLENLLYPVLVIAIWVLRPRLEKLSLVGYLMGLTALINIALALILPAKGLFTSEAGSLIAPDKQILPWGVLVGVFSGGNVAGQFMAVGIPTVALVRNILHRSAITAVVSFALLWTSARSSLMALGVVLAVFALITVLRPSGRGTAVATIVTGLLITVVAVPLSTHTYASFTNRGYIWAMSLADWADNPWFGLGSDWYHRIGRYMNALPATAYHGHNMSVHSLVIGGVLYASLLLALIVVLTYYSMAWAIRGVAYPSAMVAALLVSCTLEVPVGIIDRTFMFVVTAVPFAVVLFAPLPASPLQHGDHVDLHLPQAMDAPGAGVSSG